MNKSKFLKRSLAALLAILMVVAMIPMSALAEETEAFVFPDTITVNNRNAVYDTANNRYNVTVSDTTLASVSWTPVAERKVEITTYRGITETVPYDNLDLLTEAEKIEDNVYELKLTVTDTKANEKHPTVLRITVDVTVPNDDASLQAVRVNQTFSVDNQPYAFNAIKGEIVNDSEIQIILPLGMTADEVGFDEDDFGGSSSSADSSIVSRVFAPSSAFASVKYADGSDILTGKVTVTAATGRTHEYTVHYVQEDGLTGVAVNFGTNHVGEVPLSERTFDPDGKVATYSAYVDGLASLIDDVHVTFNKGENVVRVEDPNEATMTWDHTADPAVDEPIQSDENTIEFKAESAGVYVAYLSVKTKANYEHHTVSAAAHYKNVRLELRELSTSPVIEDPKLIEFQLNGYEAVYNEGGLGNEITYYVDDAYFTANVGAGTLASRISLRTDGAATVSIPAQTGNADGDFWKSVPQTTEGARIGKPVNGHSYIANVDAGAKSFKVRVAKNPDDNSEGRIYTINLKSVSTNSRNIKTLSLVYKTGINRGTVYKEATLTSGGVFEFALPDSDFNNVPAVTHQPAVPHADATFANVPTDDGTYSFDKESGGFIDRFKFSADFFKNLAIKISTIESNDEVIAKANDQIKLLVTDTADEYKLQFGTDDSWTDAVTGTYDSTTGVITFDEVGTITITYVHAAVWNDGTAKPEGSLNKTIFTGLFNGDSYIFVNTTDGDKELTYVEEVEAKDEVAAKDAYTELASTLLSDFYLVAKTGDGSSSSSNSKTGAVVTPGGTWAATKTTTEEVGKSAWRPSESGTTDGTYDDTATCYTELENGVTTLGALWDTDYLLRKSGTTYVKATGDEQSGDMLVLTVTNRNTSGAANTTAWGVTFKKANQTTTNPPKSEEANLTIKRATSALDEDLIYGGRTVGSFATLNTVAPNTDAPYIGAIGGHNEYKVDEPKKVNGGPDNAYYIAVHVPEDFGTETGGAVADRYIHLDQMVLSTGATVTTDATHADANVYEPDIVNTWPVKNMVTELSLDMDDQTQAGNAGKKFTITDDEQAKAWFNGSPRITEVEDGNILYVNSEKDEAAGKTGMNSTRVYYIITVKDSWAKKNNLSGITSEDVAITGGRYQKVININVPYSYNWSNYRDSDRYDFSLKFGKDGTAVLVDAYSNAIHTPFGTNPVSDPEYLDKSKQTLRNVQLTDNSTFFVKDNELWTVDELTGDEVQITGRGNGVKYSDATWGTIVTGEAELHVYNESQSMIDIYRLRLNIQDASKANEIVSIRVDETPAVKTDKENVWSVDLSNATDVDLSKVALNITVAPTATIESVDNAPYEANVKKYDLTKDIKIVVVAENKDKAEYTLTAGNGGDDPTPPTPDKKPSDSYTDLDKVYSGHRERVIYAIDNGLMSNDGTAGVFNSEGKIARRDFALIIARADMRAENPDAKDVDALLREKYADTPDAFDDIASLNATQKAALAYCKEKNIISGNGKGGFNPAGAVSREDAAIMIAGWCGLEHTDTENTNNIKDWNSVSSWAKPFVNAAYKAGLMNGTGNDNFTPARNLNRGEAAYIIVGALDQKVPSSN